MRMGTTGNLVTLTDTFTTEDEARAFLEGLRWPNGPVCPHCEGEGAYKITPKPGRKMGHLTATGRTVHEAQDRVVAARDALLR